MKLEGIKVLDLSMYLPGPHLTMMMADHGAEVVRIEAPPAGEPTRALGASQNGMTVWFRNTHRNKKSIVLDLKQPAAVKAFMRLAEQADVVIEAFRPGVVDRLGIGAPAVRARNPRLVYCSISAFGQTGPLAQRPAHDLSIAAESGVTSLTRGRDGDPAIMGVAAVDAVSSLMALSGILMALLRREATGVGDTLDISMQDSLVSWMVNNISPVFAEGRELDTTTERTLGGTAFYNIYRCADGRSLTLGGSEMKFVENLLRALGRPDLIDPCRLPPGRGQDPVRDFLAATFATRPLAEWEAFLANLDLCWAPVKGVAEAMRSEHLRARQMRLEFPDGQTHLGIPIKFADEPGAVRPVAPALGEHTRSVLAAVGYGEAELDAMARSGAIR
jgi:crotonobetainyl-CoA:carnitine CoA-transferase CaiB-like acyl-CoA transferase